MTQEFRQQLPCVSSRYNSPFVITNDVLTLTPTGLRRSPGNPIEVRRTENKRKSLAGIRRNVSDTDQTPVGAHQNFPLS